MKKRLEALIKEWRHEADLYERNAKDADMGGSDGLARQHRNRRRAILNCITDLEKIVRDCTHENEA